jgi:hypothetical protein
MERWWFTAVFAGREADFPWTDEDPDADFHVEPGESTAKILDLYRGETGRSREIEATAGSLDDQAARSLNRRGIDTRFNLRWIISHMIEETARHNGHADILREQIDGTTGV